MDYLKTPNYYSENIEDPSEGGEEQNNQKFKVIQVEKLAKT